MLVAKGRGEVSMRREYLLRPEVLLGFAGSVGGDLGCTRTGADRVLATGETLDSKALASVPSNVRDLSVYTSDGFGLQKQAQESFPKDISIPEVQQPERQYRGFGLSRYLSR